MQPYMVNHAECDSVNASAAQAEQCRENIDSGVIEKIPLAQCKQ